MKSRIVYSLIVAVALTVATAGVALAHGEPVIAVQPAVVAAGGQITVTGTEMEPGEVFAISLQSPAVSIPLGEATVTGEGEEGGFVATFTIPADTAPGSYTVRAATEEGEAAIADLTVTAPSEAASAGPATILEPTGEPHRIDRAKPIGQIAAVIAAIALSSAAGFVLVRSRGRPAARLVVDPVCKMEFSADTGAATMQFNRRTYYFCHVACLRLFEANPLAYVSEAGSEDNASPDGAGASE